jgi:hypothetical protein
MGFAQSPPEPLQTPWEGVPERFRNLSIGKLAIPATLNQWRSQRPRIKGIVLDSLGELPPRHSPPAVKIAGVDRKPGWRIEKFEVHNGVDPLVPGYIGIPQGGQPRHPAILTMHGHSSRKDNMLGYEPTSQNVAELLVKQGYVVLGIDNCFNGERKGKGPAGSPLEGMKKLEQILAGFYKLYGKPESFQSIIYPETVHVYNHDMKRRIVAWFNRHLGGGHP